MCMSALHVWHVDCPGFAGVVPVYYCLFPEQPIFCKSCIVGPQLTNTLTGILSSSYRVARNLTSSSHDFMKYYGQLSSSHDQLVEFLYGLLGIMILGTTFKSDWLK